MGQFENMMTFTKIVHAGSISRAADQMNIAKSVVSRRLKDLEGRLDVQLMNRTTRKSSLTEAGQSYYQRASQILADLDELNAVTSKAKVLLQGELRIALPLSFGLQHLVPIINEFADLHPDLVMNLDFSDRHIDLVEDGFDVAIRIADLKDSSHIARKLAPIRIILCASPDYLKKHPAPKTPKDLKDHDVLQYISTSGVPWVFSDPKGKKIPVRLSGKMSSNNGDFLKEAALSGQGIARLPTFVAYKDLKSGKLERVLTDYTSPSLNAYALYPQTRHLSARVRAFIDFLTDKFKGEPYWDEGV
ncbi:MAG: LysR family transcriptional regulator [Rhodospirillaceae bacterium]|nr:MAG: LysR family transcriptional regulator [Rhodospirillaceae bacterium]